MRKTSLWLFFLFALLSAVVVWASTASREVLVFIGDGGIWLLDLVKKQPQIWVKRDDLHSYSISTNAVIAYEYRPGWGDESDIEISLEPGSTPVNITNDKRSFYPLVAPDGSRIIYQKIDREKRFQGDYVGTGIWSYSPSKGEHKQIVGVVAIPPDVRSRTGRAWGSKGEMKDNFWTIDTHFLWSIDSDSFLFLRDFPYGPAVYLSVDLTEEPPNTKILPQGLSFLAYGKSEIVAATENGIVALEPKSGMQRLLNADVKHVIRAKFSPGGTIIACLICPRGEDLCSVGLLDYPSGKTRMLTKAIVDFPPHGEPELNWKVDSSHVTVESFDDSGSGALSGTLSINAASGEIENLGWSISKPSWTILREESKLP